MQTDLVLLRTLSFQASHFYDYASDKTDFRAGTFYLQDFCEKRQKIPRKCRNDLKCDKFVYYHCLLLKSNKIALGCKKELPLFVWKRWAKERRRDRSRMDYVRIKPRSWSHECVIEGEIVTQIVCFTIIIPVSTSRSYYKDSLSSNWRIWRHFRHESISLLIHYFQAPALAPSNQFLRKGNSDAWWN